MRQINRGIRCQQLSLRAWGQVKQPMPDDGEASLGFAETYAKQETERDIAVRLAALEAMDPSQKRPTPKSRTLNKAQ